MPDSKTEQELPSQLEPSPWKNTKPKNYKETFKVRPIIACSTSPCEDASKASMDCLNRNDYDRDKCLDFFQAYRDCKKAWMEQRRADRQAGRR
ncbi:hypothetical protein HETIRDRAFT_49646 [Heterobasidion irregulare TC 32-1]|uniref:CHCH domain-containing protein n=1 Tax=Heterobasidion irregulare (strain TC 32-1) TaxID=747525 RepID=W4K1M0_HETIT|nr:uncharacterized protein HETIRDRAFT_49646 [Heterobasidion irregulare TC 32-1]ETW78986.1 hypothetical protein HETIRDRAFT_49646 [Heterobasidion irregulare TC 32-1]